jgi:hypothetical protein
MSHFTSTQTTSIELDGFTRPMLDAEPVLMRRSGVADALRLRELARLDSKRMPAGPFIVADVAGEVVAAVSLSSGTIVADPFRPTGDAVAMLRLRALQVSGAAAVAAQRDGALTLAAAAAA